MAKPRVTKGKITRLCFCCGKKLGVMNYTGEDQVHYPPMDATAWTSQGNYGSTLFDPMNGTYLELFVCDPCLKKHKDRLVWIAEEKKTTTKVHILNKKGLF